MPTLQVENERTGETEGVGLLPTLGQKLIEMSSEWILLCRINHYFFSPSLFSVFSKPIYQNLHRLLERMITVLCRAGQSITTAQGFWLTLLRTWLKPGPTSSLPTLSPRDKDSWAHGENRLTF